jgi:GrpB-like predicted nucleotidyltransferase (UPF0157 family)
MISDMDNANRINELVKEEICIEPYNSEWPALFKKEKEFLIKLLPGTIVKRVEHFGSTAVKGLSAKPVVDILVEVSSFEETIEKIVPLLASEGYEYFWRPVSNNEADVYYAWFIRRNSIGKRTHHIHMVEKNSRLWDRLFFRDYLIEFPDAAKKYEKLKNKLAFNYPNDRVSYTKGKTDFILEMTEKAKRYYSDKNH